MLSIIRKNFSIPVSLFIASTAIADTFVVEFSKDDINRTPQGWKADGAVFSVKADADGTVYLRGSNDDPSVSTYCSRGLDIPAGSIGVSVKANMRVENAAGGSNFWERPRVRFNFLDEQGKNIGQWQVLLAVEKIKEWQEVEQGIDIPKDAVRMDLAAEFWKGTGVLDVSRLEVVFGGAGGLPVADDVESSGKAVWDVAAAEKVSSVRERLCLNGTWRFAPAMENETRVPGKKEFGLISVPGSWLQPSKLPGAIAAGKGERWRQPLASLDSAWYSCELQIPSSWSGSRVILDLRRFSTEATVFLNGRKLGTLKWPYGEIDLSSAVKYGGVNLLAIRVDTSLSDAEAFTAMGVGAGQLERRAARLESKGIIGEVFLERRPKGNIVEKIQILSSTRDMELGVRIWMSDSKGGSEGYKISTRVRSANGGIVKDFEEKVARVGADGYIKLSWPWPEAQAWDFRQPILYRLELKVDGKNTNDVYTQDFGFREFRVDGRGFVLNEKSINLRPTVMDERWGDAMSVAAIDSFIVQRMARGFNVIQLWPWDHNERGRVHFRELFCERADRLGMLVIGASLDMKPLMMAKENEDFLWVKPGMKERFESEMRTELERYWNHPSVIMWGSSGNWFGHNQDQNPMFIGRSGWPGLNETHYRKLCAYGREGMEMVKRHDPTRPFFTHMGGPLFGDVFTTNNYLCMTPLQERREWLSHWADTRADSKHPALPYIAVEFGTPLDSTMMRGRSHGGWNGGGAAHSEPLMTEWLASVFGADAYTMETSAYRAAIPRKFEEGMARGERDQAWLSRSNARSMHEKRQLYSTWQGEKVVEHDSGFQKLQELFIRETWRMWRGFGVSGGMVPWNDSQFWRPISFPRGGDDDTAKAPERGVRRGMRHFSLGVEKVADMTAKNATPGGVALIKNNGDTLAWIAGREIAGDSASFTEQSHHFYAGATVHKQVALVNDTRSKQVGAFTWTAKVGGDPVANGEGQMELEPGTRVFVPLSFVLPQSLSAAKLDGGITLEASIGSNPHTDTFSFRVYSERFADIPGLPLDVEIFDPAGTTTTALAKLGVKTSPWTGGKSDKVLVIGRGAMSRPEKPPGDLEAFVEGGSRVLVFAQDPDWTRNHLGLRVSRIIERHVFPMPGAAAEFARGLDADDLRDWNGTGNLLPAYVPPANPAGEAPYGWRWGNRGSVASAAVEKPHHGAWRPLLECGFDLAYSPLMELNFGKGLLLWCGLDLEDNIGLDPVADALTSRTLARAANLPIAARRKTSLIGEDEDAELLKSMGVVYNSLEQVPKNGKGKLLVLGSKSVPDERDLAIFIESGGNLLCLPRLPGNGVLGTQIKSVPDFNGSIDIPDWPECTGIGAGDLRWRVDCPGVVITGGCDKTGADGLLGIKRLGEGAAVFFQVDPRHFPAEDKTYLRLTRWRATRTLGQLLTNLGASFSMDRRIFNPVGAGEISISGEWRGRLTNPLPTTKRYAERHKDEGLSKLAKMAVKPGFDDSQWEVVVLPGIMETFGPDWEDKDGEAVFRRGFDVPREMLDSELTVKLGPIDDFDSVFLNGERIGGLGEEMPRSFAVPREYKVPAGLLKESGNVLVVRLFDHFGVGGLVGRPEQMSIGPPTAEGSGFYHHDYISTAENFNLGDDPARYKRW